MLVPGWNELILASARTSVSCTRSSARSTFPHSEIANAREARHRRKNGFADQLVDGHQCLSLLPIALEPIEQRCKTVRYALIDDFVVHRAKLLTETRLDFATELGRLGGRLLVSLRRDFHRFLLPHGLTLGHRFDPKSPTPGFLLQGAGSPSSVFAKPLSGQMVPPNWNFFPNGTLWA